MAIASIAAVASAAGEALEVGTTAPRPSRGLHGVGRGVGGVNVHPAAWTQSKKMKLKKRRLIIARKWKR